MADCAEPLLAWKPTPANDIWAYIGRAVSLFCYPALFPYAVFFHSPANVENARFYRSYFVVSGLLGAVLGHALAWRRFGRVLPLGAAHIGSQVLWALTWDHTYAWLAGISHQMISIFGVNRKQNRLNRGALHGPRVLVVGNGPSALEGEQYGVDVDKFDEVVRFNNFQNKVAGLEKWVGTKTTVHFSDGVLYPTYSEYHVPGADIILSLFADRYFVAGSYFIMRGGADLQYRLTSRFLMDPSITWIEKDRIENLKRKLGLSGPKHPTSGMLAIDYFVNKPGVQLPVYIHGFDFFMGPKIHYFHDHEPLYERINNNIGVNMHSPHLEKIYVEKLIAEGKVKFLKDMAK